MSGASWAATQSPAIWGLSRSAIYIAVWRSLYECSDNGAELACKGVQLSLGPLQVLFDVGGADGAIYAVGDNLVLAGPAGWSNIYNEPSNVAFFGVHCVSGTDCYFAGARRDAPFGATLMRWNKGQWTFERDQPGLSQFNDVWSAGSNVVAAGGPYCIIDFKPAGGVWQQHDLTGCPAGFQAVWGASGADVHAVGTGGLLVHTVGSPSWKIVGTVGDDLIGLWGADRENVYAAGVQGALWRYRSGWTKVASGTSATLTSVWGTGADVVYVVGEGATVLRCGG